MKKGGGHRKGSSFERKVAKLFDLWWEVPKYTFWRTVLSGGWHQPGDISIRTVNGEPIKWPFIVECKHYKTIDFWDVLKSSKNIKLFKWWNQVTIDQRKVSVPYPIRLLIVHANNTPIIVIFDEQELKGPVYTGIRVMRFEFMHSRYGLQRLTALPWEIFSVYYNRNKIEEYYEK